MNQTSETSQSSEIRFIPLQPGKVSCIARNSIGSDQISAQVKVGDIEEQFQITGINETDEIVIDDEITLECATSIYEHSGIINWYKNGELIEDDENETSVKRSFTNFTWKSSLIFNGIKKSDEGDYICEVQDKLSGQMNSKSVRIDVNEAETPVIRTSFIGMNKNLEIGETMSIECVIVAGLPLPVLSW